MSTVNSEKTREIRHGSVTLKIYEINRSNRVLYSVCHKENGRRKYKQFGDIALALQWAENRAKEIDKGKASALMLSHNDGLIYSKAKAFLVGTGKQLDEVVKDAVEANRILEWKVKLSEAAEFYAQKRLRIKQRTVPEVVKELLESRVHKSQRHYKDLVSRLGRFAKDNTGYVSNITEGEITQWLRGLGLSPRSHDNFRGVIVLLFRFAQKKGYLSGERTEAEKTEPMGDNSEGEIAIFNPAEITRLLNAAGNDVLPYLALGAFAGIRTAEIQRLDWQEINFENGYIEIKKAKAKTKGRRLIKMQPNLIEWLKTVAKPSGLVTPLIRPEKTASEIIAARLKPPITWKRNGLRHSYCTYRYAISQNEHEVSAEMGNSPAMIFANYRALATKEQAQEWFNIFPANGNVKIRT